MTMRAVLAMSLVAASAASAAPIAPPVVTSTGQGPVALASGAFPACELSGIAWLGGDAYLAVGDNGAASLW
ncbi:MAG: hypothetical protein RLZZ238_424, partial [Planctomycetota bacterium]